MTEAEIKRAAQLVLDRNYAKDQLEWFLADEDYASDKYPMACLTLGVVKYDGGTNNGDPVTVSREAAEAAFRAVETHCQAELDKMGITL